MKSSVKRFQSGLFNFRPAVRPVPINVHISGFPGQHYCPRMALMNKPAFKGFAVLALEKFLQLLSAVLGLQ